MTGPINGYGSSGVQLPINKTLQQSGQGTQDKTAETSSPQETGAPAEQSSQIDAKALVRQAFASHLANSGGISEHGEEAKEAPRGSLVDITV